MVTDSSEGRLIGGRYRVGGLVSSGGSGRVYRAVQEPLGRPVALKILRAELPEEERRAFEERFFREAALVGQLQHPNVVTVHDFGRTEGGECYIVMEFLEGHLLSHLLREGPVPARRAMRIFEQMALGLRHAHGRGLVHRDIKPSNVILLPGEDGEDRVKVLDFGLVKDVGVEATLTEVGTFMGTPPYMAPEQAQGRIADQRTDVYAFGVLMYRALAGKLPYTAANPAAMAYKHVHEPYPPMASRAPDVYVPAPLEAVCRRCMEKAPRRRYADASELLDAIRRASSRVFGPEGAFPGERQGAVESAEALEPVFEEAVDDVPTDVGSASTPPEPESPPVGGLAPPAHRPRPLASQNTLIPDEEREEPPASPEEPASSPPPPASPAPGSPTPARSASVRRGFPLLPLIPVGLVALGVGGVMAWAPWQRSASPAGEAPSVSGAPVAETAPEREVPSEGAATADRPGPGEPEGPPPPEPAEGKASPEATEEEESAAAAEPVGEGPAGEGPAGEGSAGETQGVATAGEPEGESAPEGSDDLVFVGFDESAEASASGGKTASEKEIVPEPEPVPEPESPAETEPESTTDAGTGGEGRVTTGARATDVARATDLDGVRFDATEAASALRFANEASEGDLRRAGVAGRQVNIILKERPFSSLQALADTPYIGPKTMEAVRWGATSP